MSQYTDENGIKYNNATIGSGMPKITNRFNDYDDLEAGIEPVINAVEIDWNGAQLGDKEINTTGELLSH